MKIKIALISLLIAPVLVFAQNGAALPNAGLTPESPFYFLDKLGETLREFFTFNPEGKARLQITFAAERIAEIKVVLETKGVDTKGLEVAEARLREHLGDAAEIVIKQKGKGKDVSALAKELNDKFEDSKSVLNDSFKTEKRALKTKEDELKDQLKAARKTSDAAKVEALVKELGEVKAELELLELKKDELEDELDEEEERLEDEMDAREDAEEAIKEAKEEREELMEEVTEEGVKLPANAFISFDNLLAQAEGAFQAGNYQEAERLAKQAEDTLESVDDTIDDFEDVMEENEDEDENGGDEENIDEEANEENGDDENASQVSPKSIKVTLSSQNNSGESGKAELKGDNGKTMVKLDLDGAPKTPQPAHIHTGSCANLGGVKYPLRSSRFLVLAR